MEEVLIAVGSGLIVALILGLFAVSLIPKAILKQANDALKASNDSVRQSADDYMRARDLAIEHNKALVEKIAELSRLYEETKEGLAAASRREQHYARLAVWLRSEFVRLTGTEPGVMPGTGPLTPPSP